MVTVSFCADAEATHTISSPARASFIVRLLRAIQAQLHHYRLGTTSRTLQTKTWRIFIFLLRLSCSRERARPNGLRQQESYHEHADCHWPDSWTARGTMVWARALRNTTCSFPRHA